MKWQSKFANLLESPAGLSAVVLLAVVCVPLSIALPVGVKITALNLEWGANARWFWLGLGMQAAGILFWEIFIRLHDRHCRTDHSPPPASLVWLIRADVLALQLITVLLFALLMDGGVRFRASLYVYLLYAIPALLVLTLRRKSWTRWEVLFLRWAWAPILALGIPLLLPALKAAGLVRFIT